ncbi:MAG: peptidoglycan DD-metalloendopeptidase family protein [Xanthomonadaceae bacterium]|nr:peptidoglycan DD-metalloendopeptidase family protein [Xanthomonadaceae bacterium]
MRFRTAILALSMLPVLAHALPDHLPAPGGVAVVPLEANGARPDVRYTDRPVLTVRDSNGQWLAVVGIPLSAQPGNHALRVGDREVPFEVHDREYATQRLTIPNERMVNPLPADLERIASERPRIVAALNTFNERPPEALRLVAPAEGRRSSAFGLRRVLNDQPRNPHAGIDIAAPTGTPIHAPAPGIVVETGDFFYAGNAVFVDHGSGLISAKRLMGFSRLCKSR